MSRYQFPAYVKATTPRYIIVWGLQWQLLDCTRVEPGSDLRRAMDETIERLGRDGWLAEDDARYGFVFIRRDGERRLLMLTARDPQDDSQQAFNPFR